MAFESNARRLNQQRLEDMRTDNGDGDLGIMNEQGQDH